MPFDGYGYTAEFQAETVRRFANGETIDGIANDTYNTAEDVEELIRNYIRRHIGRGMEEYKWHGRN